MKYALVTGGSRGIGRAICCKLSSMGYYILINYQSNENEAMITLEKVRQLGSDGELLKFNVADSVETNQVLDQWNAEHSGEYIEVLVNNAGVRKDNLMIWMPEDDWHNVVNTGLDGFFFVTQSLLKNMLIRKYGRIINIVSLSGIKGMPGQVNYSAAKGGIIAGTKALSQEVARKNVTVNAVAPGFISTDMTHDLDESDLKKVVPMGRFGKAEEVADLVGFLASKQAAYITGEVISINGGLYT
ncbi:3-oxoacyl-ACP reductase FabG [Bacteroides ihuae]|uniref:3-oxoacyl-ACP reductase FabG n=1 Tax=Bacteroides ihuae TaxID=1852362 RepID=UPI0008D9C2DE|nr:3-oxoacyl-ACP reductase FabG [Bacteroides ihuae]